MIPGPYSICHVEFSDADSDSATYRTIKWGYDSAEQAWRDIEAVAVEAGVAAADCAVIRQIDREESADFSS